jgi:hypothetical protein
MKSRDHITHLAPMVDYRGQRERIAGSALNLQRCLRAIEVAQHGLTSVTARLDRLSADILAITAGIGIPDGTTGDPCEFCGYRFDIAACGRFGCPNCHGEGLVDDGQEKKQ